MSFDFVYRDWRLSYGEPHSDVYPEEEARARFEAGGSITVLTGAPDRPETVAKIDLGGREVEVVWLDPLLGPELSYVFAVPDADDWPADQLLLAQTHIRTYDHDTPLPDGDPTYDETTRFHADGRFFGRRGSRDGSDAEESHGALSSGQLAELTEEVPRFGEWASILRRER